MNIKQLHDSDSERAILSSIYTHGKDAFIEADAFVDEPSDFYNATNKNLYSIFSSIYNSGSEDFTYENIKRHARVLSLQSQVENNEFISYLSVLDVAPPEIQTLQDFCHDIKKWRICRDMKSACKSINTYIDKDVSTKTSIVDVISHCESKMLDFIDGSTSDLDISLLVSDLGQVVAERMNATELRAIGIGTGFPIWDSLIGGGPRRGGTSFIMARPKVGKSTLALNQAYNVARRNIPVLYLDSELNKTAVLDKIICLHSGIPIPQWESTSFRENPVHMDSARKLQQEISQLGLGYLNIAGKDIYSIISMCRRWINKFVGFDDNGKANPCLIIYDYFKLTSLDNSKGQAEWLQLGLMLTSLNTFLIKYEVPLVSFGQMNRTGIENSGGAAIAGSDRILWFCNDYSELRNKTDEDDELTGCGWDHGNKKLAIIETRYGPGMTDSDYINIKARIRPRCYSEQATGKMVEGELYSTVLQSNT